MVGKCVPVYSRGGVVQISDNKTIDTKLQAVVYHFADKRLPLLTEANIMEQIKRGEIYYANLCPVVGSEQGGDRPVIILQNNKGNKHSSTTIVAAITGELDKPNLPTHVMFKSDCMRKESMVLLEQIRTIDKSRLGRFVGTMDSKTIKRVDKAILISFGLDYLEGLKK